ncbi:MAG: hypothetical protein M1822_008625 [Bathelium mastoideum]|nr:MAG: hypothetical protein M1822_008625 [Bathelium mastoideum]
MWSQKQHDTALISECRDDNLRGVQTFGTPVSGLSNEDSNGILKDSSLRESTQITSLGCVDYSALRDEEVDCRQVVSAGRFLITNTLRDILERHTEPKPWSIQEVYTFERLIERTKIQVQGRMDRLQDPNTLDALNDVILADTDINQHSLPPREASIESWTLVPTSQNRVFLHWARKVLGLMLEKAYCTLYQPLEACSDQAVWQRFRESAVSHFHAYIKDYITMCTEPSYVAFQWVYPGNYQPLQAVAFLLMDTLKNPTSSQALTSRDLIDRVFSMLSHDGGVVAEQNGRLQQRSISRSGQEAWNMLLQLRRRVWRNMGVDPSVLWTCAHQHDDAHDDPNSNSYSEEKSSTEGAPRSVEDPQMPRSSNMYDSQQQPTIDSFSMDLHELEPGDQSHNFGSFDWIM